MNVLDILFARKIGGGGGGGSEVVDNPLINWQQVGVLNLDSSLTNRIAYGNGLLVIATPTDIKVSNDKGLTWVSKTAPYTSNSFNGYSILEYINGCFFCVVPAAGLVFKSNDNCDTWEELSLSISSYNEHKIAGDGNETIVVTDFSKIYYSIDNGETFAQATYDYNTYGGVYQVCYGNDVFMIISSSGYVCTSSDGSNFTNVGNTRSLYSSDYLQYINYKFIFNYYDSYYYSSAIYESTDNGVTWTKKTTGIVARSILIYKYNKYIQVSGNIIAISDDDMQTWKMYYTTVSTDIIGIDTELYTLHGGHLYKYIPTIRISDIPLSIMSIKNIFYRTFIVEVGVKKNGNASTVIFDGGNTDILLGVKRLNMQSSGNYTVPYISNSQNYGGRIVNNISNNKLIVELYSNSASTEYKELFYGVAIMQEEDDT